MSTVSPEIPGSVSSALEAEGFRQMGHAVVDLLADYLAQATRAGAENPMPVLPHADPNAMAERWATDFSFVDLAGTETDRLVKLLQQVLAGSNHLHHPRYLGHQVSAPLPVTALCEMVAGLLNNGTAVYEMGPVSTAMERAVIRWMAGQIGYEAEAADGFLTSGGSAGNLTALLAARQAMAGYDVWTEGQSRQEPLCVLASGQIHYSLQRVAQILGWGQGGIVPVALDAEFRMDPAALAEAYQTAQRQGRKVIAVVANACSTATGSYDPLPAIADFCEAHGLWLHVDGAHGASAALSDTYRSLVVGLDRADSVVWDAHKIMQMPGLITAVLFKRGRDSYQAFSQQASYLFEKDPQEEWFNLAHRTLECTKRMLSLKLYVALKLYGKGVFSNFIDQTYGLARHFGTMLETAPDFELALSPQSNIVCFRHTPKGWAGDLDDLQAFLRKSLLEEARFYVVQTRLPKGLHLRTTLMNPLTQPEDLAALLTEIRRLGAQYLGQKR